MTLLAIILGAIVIAQLFAIRWYRQKLADTEQDHALSVLAIAHYMADAVKDKLGAFDEFSEEDQYDFIRDAGAWLKDFYDRRIAAHNKDVA